MKQFSFLKLIALLFIAQPIFGQKGYVLNQNNNTISIIDTISNSVTGVIQDSRLSGANYMVISPDGTTLYVAVTSLNNNGVVTINTATDTVTGIITSDLLPSPQVIAITPDGKKLYAVNGNAIISVIDTATQTVSEVIDTDDLLTTPYGIAISPDGTKGYIADEAYVEILDVATDALLPNVIPFISNSNIVAFAPNGVFAYVTDHAHSVGIIDVATDTLDAHSPITGPSITDPFGIAFSSDSTLAYIYNNQNVSIIDIPTQSITGVIDGGGDQWFLALDNNGTLYIPNGNDFSNSVSWVNQPASCIPSTLTSPCITSGNVSDPHHTFHIPEQVVFVPIFSGCKTKNIFLTQTDLINRLTWGSITNPTPSNYRIYNDVLRTQFVGAAPSGATSFDVHNTNGSNQTYYLFASYPNGTMTQIASTTVTANC